IYTESIRGPRIFLGSLAKVSLYPRIPIEREPKSTITVRESLLKLPLHDLPTKQVAREILEKCESDLASVLKSKASLARLNIARRYRQWAVALCKHVSSGGKASLEASLQVIGIGEIAVVAVPGETFTKLGTEVKRLSPFSSTLFVGYSNGMLCYI